MSSLNEKAAVAEISLQGIGSWALGWLGHSWAWLTELLQHLLSFRHVPASVLDSGTAGRKAIGSKEITTTERPLVAVGGGMLPLEADMHSSFRRLIILHELPLSVADLLVFPDHHHSNTAAPVTPARPHMRML